ncbi:MAG: O-antigen ligase family protein [Anaerolineae bacterium]
MTPKTGPLPTWQKGTPSWFLFLEIGVVALAAPFLLFPTFHSRWTAMALVALVLVWALRWLVTGRPGVPTPLDLSLLVLTLMIPVAVWASALPEVTLPKLTGLILGLAIFRLTAAAVRTRRGLVGATAAFLLVGLGVAIFGALGSAWPSKVWVVGLLLDAVPQWAQGLPGVKAGINVNELGGALILILPVSLAMCLVSAKNAWRSWAVRLAGLLSSLALGTLLLLTQSRSAWIGLAVGLATMIGVRWRWARILLGGAIAALVLVLWRMGPATVMQSLFQVVSDSEIGVLVGTVSLEGRMEIWNRALYAIQDFPFTGTGLGTFRQVVWVLYPLFLISPDFDIGHAHNVFLQVALDLGLPGLIAYLALVGTAGWLCWRAARSAGNPARWLAFGVLGSLVAFHTYGMTDAIALGAKPGVIFWLLMALAVALGTIGQGAEADSQKAVESAEVESG